MWETWRFVLQSEVAAGCCKRGLAIPVDTGGGANCCSSATNALGSFSGVCQRNTYQINVYYPPWLAARELGYAAAHHHWQLLPTPLAQQIRNDWEERPHNTCHNYNISPVREPISQGMPKRNLRKVCTMCFSYLEKKNPNNIGKAVSGKMLWEADLHPSTVINHSWGSSQCIVFAYTLVKSPRLWFPSESLLHVCYP